MAHPVTRLTQQAPPAIPGRRYKAGAFDGRAPGAVPSAISYIPTYRPRRRP